MSTSSVETWTQGRVIGPYVLVRELARGGMGEIWLARQTGTAGFDRLVVLKRVIHSSDEDPATLTMFLDEARIASQLHHPNIVQVFELRDEANATFLVMEYLAGQTVSRFARKMVTKAGRVPAQYAVQIIALAAKGLGYAHRRVDLEGKPLQIVHRDVSPQNLFITYDGQVKVLDFGIAHASGRLGKTSTGVLKGKISYMSPEQAVGERVTGAADVFSLAIILFEALTGTRYYGKVEEMAVLRRLSTFPAPYDPSERGPLDPELSAMLVKALQPNPEHRFADGQLFFEALDSWLRRHPLAPNEPTLDAVMTELFRDEVRELGEFHKLAGRTPVVGSNPSMPNRTTARPASRRTPWVLLGVSAVVVALISGVVIKAQRAEPTSPVVDAGTELARAPEPTVDAGSPLPPEPVAATPVIVDAGTTPPPEPVVEKGPPAPGPDSSSSGRAPATGKLTLDTEPWTKVMLGKRSLGDTPLIDLTLPAGNHRLRLMNPAEGIDTVIEVTIKPRETTQKRLAF